MQDIAYIALIKKYEILFIHSKQHARWARKKTTELILCFVSRAKCSKFGSETTTPAGYWGFGHIYWRTP